MSHEPISQRSEGPSVDSLGLKVTGDTSLDLDLRRTQEVEVTFRGTVVSHTFEDKRDKHGNVEHTIKWAKIKVDELVEIQVLTVPRRMPGQTAMTVAPLPGAERERTRVLEEALTPEQAGALLDLLRERGVEVGGVTTCAEPLYSAMAALASLAADDAEPEGDDGAEEIVDAEGDDGAEEIVDAEVVGELEAGEPPPGVDPQTGEVDTSVKWEGEEDEEPEEERPAPDRHPQIPEDAWNQLNLAQKWAVWEKVARLERLAEYLAGDITPTDRTVATDEHTQIHDYLEGEHGITLIPLEELPPEEQPAGEPPPPVTESDGPVGRQALMERRKYISSRMGLPGPLAEARDAELAEIDRRLKALGDAA